MHVQTAESGRGTWMHDKIQRQNHNFYRCINTPFSSKMNWSNDKTKKINMVKSQFCVGIGHESIEKGFFFTLNGHYGIPSHLDLWRYLWRSKLPHIPLLPTLRHGVTCSVKFSPVSSAVINLAPALRHRAFSPVIILTGTYWNFIRGRQRGMPCQITLFAFSC